MCLLLNKPSWLRLEIPLYFIILVTHFKLSYSNEVLHLQQKNDYYYTSLSTPNFPGEFKIPFNKTYIVDLKDMNLVNTSRIIVYLTEVYIDEPKVIKFLDAVKSSNTTWKRNSLYVSTTLNYFEIQVYIDDLYRNHLRLKSNPNKFGFNITIEVVDNNLTANANSCSVIDCSFAGTCRSFPGESGLEFRCDCVEGFSGSKCQYGPECNPAANISFCLNGGECRSYGTTGMRRCDCVKGFKGSRCQTRELQTNFVEDKHCTDTVNQEVANFRPCSRCRNFSATDSQRYVILLRNNETFNEVEKVLRTQFKSNFTISSKTSTKKGLAVEVYGKLQLTSRLPDGMSVFKAQSSKRSSLTSSDELMKTEIGINKIIMKEGDEFSLTCKTVVKRSKESVIDFVWFKDDVLIRDKYTIEPRDISTYYPADHHYGLLQPQNYMLQLSVLVVDKLTLADKGVFTCQVTDLIRNIQTCVSTNVSVVPVPNIKITPMSVSILRGESMLLTCTDTKGPHETTWYKGDKEVGVYGDDLHLYRTEKMYPHGAILRILSAQESGTFTCVAKNSAGRSSKQVRVEVLESRADRFESCSGIWEDLTEFRMSWNVTKIGQVAISPCPAGFLGSAHKKCRRSESEEIGQWDPTDFSRCTHLSLVQINSTLLNIKSGFGVTEIGLDILPILMDGYIDARKRNRTDSLLFGETDPLMSLLSDIFKYLNKLSLTAPQLIKDSTVRNLTNTTDKVFGLSHSTANKVKAFTLIAEFVKFAETTKLKEVDTKHINIETLPLVYFEEGERSIHVNKTSTSLDFEYHPVDYGKVDRELKIVQFSNISSLFNYTKDEEEFELISDIVQVTVIQKNDVSPYVIKDNTCFDIKFNTKSDVSHKKVTCGSLNTSHANFTTSVCTVNATSAFTVTCSCNRFEVFAVFAVREHIIIPPQANEIFSPPPNWIATSGCLVCLVLVLRSLVATLIQRVFDAFYFMTTGGIIFSMVLLLILILSAESRAIALIYLTLTLFIKSLRIWRQLLIYDIHEMYPWLENMSRWIPLTVILTTLILPLLTVSFVESIQPSAPEEFILHQSSPVLLTFFTTFCVSNLIIFAVHYKTYLRVSGKSTNSSSNIRYRDQSDLNQNLIGTLILMVQILSVLLYWNLKQHIFFHYFFAVSNLFVGLSWKSAQKDKSNRSPKRGSSQSHQALQSSDGCNNSISSRSVNLNPPSFANFSHNRSSANVNGKVELKRMNQFCTTKRYSSPIEEHEENDHDTVFTDFTTTNSMVSTINGGSMSVYSGQIPAKGTCRLRLDDAEYVSPST